MYLAHWKDINILRDLCQKSFQTQVYEILAIIFLHSLRMKFDLKESIIILSFWYNVSLCELF